MHMTSCAMLTLVTLLELKNHQDDYGELARVAIEWLQELPKFKWVNLPK